MRTVEVAHIMLSNISNFAQILKDFYSVVTKFAKQIKFLELYLKPK